MPAISKATLKMYPQQIPNDIRRDTRRTAELKIYDKLKEQLSKDWLVFYDVAWLSRVRGQLPEDGQTDFILIHPSYGLLLLEIKGGGISYSAVDGQWLSTDRNGAQHKIKDPFNQVERSKYALKNKLATVPALAHAMIPIFDAVAFPDIRVGEVQLRMDAPIEVIIDADDLSCLEKKILSIFNFYLAGQKQSLSQDHIGHLVNLFAPTVEFRNPLACQFAEENDEIIKLTQNQFRGLDNLRRMPRVAVGGCAGSGKTVLAIQKARTLAEEGFKTLVTCFNRPLAEFLSQSTRDCNGLEVKTFYQLCREAASHAELSVPEIGTVTQDQIDAEYPMILCEAMSKVPELKYDAIIVDEAQDFHRDWWDALDSSLVSGKQSILYVFYDDNQKIYRRPVQIPEELGFAVYDLHDNIRNAQPIFRCVEHYYATDAGRRIEPRGPAGRPVEWFKYNTSDDLRQSLSSLLKRLIEIEQIACRDIVILTPKGLDNRSILLHLDIKDRKLVKYSERKKNDEIGCASIHSFKGLESNVVILTELEEELQKRSEEELANLLYVGMSRAKNMLIVLPDKRFNEKLLPR